MSKSLEFCRTVASDVSRSSFADRDWSKAVETEAESIFDEFLYGVRRFSVDGANDMGDEIKLNVKLSFENDADFEYFTSSSCIHDGTLLFIKEMIDECVRKVCGVRTYNKNIGEPKSGATVRYIVGNFVVLNEYDGDFVSHEKPWIRERTTVLLPLKMEIEE